MLVGSSTNTLVGKVFLKIRISKYLGNFYREMLGNKLVFTSMGIDPSAPLGTGCQWSLTSWKEITDTVCLQGEVTHLESSLSNNEQNKHKN